MQSSKDRQKVRELCDKVGISIGYIKLFFLKFGIAE